METRVYSGSAAAVAAQLAEGPEAQFVSLHCNCDTDDLDVMRAAVPGAALHGATSCLGAMTQDGPTEQVAAFAISDPEGDYGTALRDLGDDPMQAGTAAVQAAIEAADRVGEVPDVIWISSAPGSEEAVMAGIESFTGPNVPIIGGSAADNSVEGNWFVFDQTDKQTNAVIVTVLFPSGRVSYAYQNGYAPTKSTGVVTRCEGRVVAEIDHRPAMEVYAEWTNDAITVPSEAEGTRPILSDSSLFPIGREVARVGSVPYYLLAHPAGARANGEMDMFAALDEGETITQMSGTVEGLTARAGRVASLARTAGGIGVGEAKGALMIYCGGCMLTVRDQIDDVVSGVADALTDVPFLGAFTFGEQGAILGAGNRHGNLMISCIIFS